MPKYHVLGTRFQILNVPIDLKISNRHSPALSLNFFQVLIQLEAAPFDDQPHWYTLHHHDSQIPPPIPSPCLPRRQMKPLRNGRNNRGDPAVHISDSDPSDVDDAVRAATGRDVNLVWHGWVCDLQRMLDLCNICRLIP